ncbi:MAG: outer membrane lipoprotein-sorting protein, partial [Fibrobacteres bacterium]|nr:outer membrane lipoprotein-sorting protein [Fibrobacterota bacterium]
MKKILIATTLLLATCTFAVPSANSILKKMEDNYKMTNDASAKVQMTQQKSEQGTKVFDMLWNRRDKDNAFLIVMTGPESEKGNGYLRMGDHFWMYRRNTRTFQHVSRDESIGGTDARGDDFESRKLTEMYEPSLEKDAKDTVVEEMLGAVPVYKFSVKAKVNDVDYPKKVYWVRRDNFLPLKETSYSSSGSLMQSAYYLKYTEVDGK